MIKFSKKQFIIAGIILIFLITLIILNDSFEPKPVQSASTDNVSGWAWSETIGWISFNNTSGGGGINYGVNVDAATGNFSGYAWSETIGWINFAPAGPYPAAPNYSANLDFATNRVRGWAKVIAADGNGWDGWIKLGDDSGTWPAGGNQVYAQTLAGPDELRGWAWGSDVVGWISFNCADRPGNLCATSNYKVLVDINFPPTATTSNIATCVLPGWNCCTDSRHPPFSWNYSDPDGDSQASYRLQVDNNSDLSSPVLDTQIVDAGSWTYTWKSSDMVPPATDFVWGAKYYWRVKVKDARGAWSVPEWSNISNFTLLPHAYPDVDFSLLPSKPSALEPVQFTDETDFYNGENSWFWTFENAVPASSILQNPVATFSSPGNWDVTLEATDDDGFMCPKTISVNVSLPLPEWKEIIPR